MRVDSTVKNKADMWVYRLADRWVDEMADKTADLKVVRMAAWMAVLTVEMTDSSKVGL